jgi:predicted ATPase/class 3 adenylate cyclase
MTSVADLPTGTVTMLFSDIEGSTLLLERLGAAYADVLTLQRRIVRGVLAEHGGVEMGTEGDSFFVVFSRAGDAVRSAVEVQRALANAEWPAAGRVRVRMGLHSGEPQRHEDGYVGMDVHLAARVAGTAHGGQVLVTDTTWGLAERAVDGVGALDLGLHRLKDIAEPQRLLQLTGEGLETAFDPPRSLGSVAGLPEPTTPLVGREEELAEALRLLGSGSRLVTIVGTAGVGKTRLGLAVAAAASSRHGDVHFVPLAGASTVQEARTAVNDALGTDLRPGGSAGAFGDRAVLVVLDNLEHLPGIGAVVSDLVASGGRVRVVATSRSALRLEGEQLLPLEPLERPEAIALFSDHLHRLRPGHRLQPADTEAVGDLVDRLDRLPLAIELVASRGRMLSPSAMLARLDDVLELRSRTERPERQASLFGALDWSWGLLADDRAAAMARLGVFTGPFGLDEAQVVTGVDGEDLLDVLQDLVEASLVGVADDSAGEPQFRLLLTVQRYAGIRLRQSGAEEETRSRHAVALRSLVTRLGPMLRTARHTSAVDLLQSQRDNIRTALDWSLRPGSPEVVTGLEICQALGWFWHTGGHAEEGLRWLGRAVEASAETSDPVAIRALHRMAVLVQQQGRYDEAADLLNTCLGHWVTVGDIGEQARVLNSLGGGERGRGDLDLARTYYRRSADLAREAGLPERVSSALGNLAELEVQGDPAEALRIMDEVIALDRARGDDWALAVDRLTIATAHLLLGEFDDAQAQLLEHGRTMLSLDDAELSVELLEAMAYLCFRREHPRAAAVLLGAVEQARSVHGLPRPAPVAALIEGYAAPLREELGSGVWQDALEEGRGLGPGHAFGLGAAAVGS